jgi:Cu-processing system ATP-binding protein
MTSDHAIEVRQVTRCFGEVRAVDGVDLAIGRGEMFGLIGHNGAGKSTLFKMMLGLLPASSGEICIHGTPTGSRDFRNVRRRIGYLPENFVTYDNLTGKEVLALYASLKRVAPSDCDRVLALAGLTQAASRRVKGYSKGMRQRLGFAQALLGQPDLLFLDEPTNGLDPEGIHAFYQVLRGLQEAGVTVVITSHILAEIQERVDRLVLLNGGRIEAEGSLAELRAGLHLPSTVSIQCGEGGAGQVREALSVLPGMELSGEGTSLRVRCAADRKVAVLERVAGLAAWITDVSIHEPSLEDVFMGYGGQHDGRH